MGFFQNTCKPEGLGGKIMVTTMNIGGGANVSQLLKRCPDGSVTGVDYSEVSVKYTGQYWITCWQGCTHARLYREQTLTSGGKICDY